MNNKLYEIIWEIKCGEFEFLQSCIKVFRTLEDAETYGLEIQNEENNGLSFKEKANDGYYYKLYSVRFLASVDGWKVGLLDN